MASGHADGCVPLVSAALMTYSITESPHEERGGIRVSKDRGALRTGRFGSLALCGHRQAHPGGLERRCATWSPPRD